MEAPFRWKRALMSALAIGAFGIAYAAWVGRGHGHALRYWMLIAPAVTLMAGGTFASSYLSQTRRRAAATLVSLATLGAAFGISELYRAKTEAVTLTDAERAPLISVDEAGQRRLKHQTLGFTILHPGPGFVDRGGQAYRPDAHFYSLVDPSSQAGLFVGLFKGEGESPGSLRKLLESMSTQLDALAGSSGAPVRLVSIETPDTEPPRGTLHATVGDRRHYRLQAHGWKPDGHTPFAILIAVAAPTAEAYSDVLASFQP